MILIRYTLWLLARLILSLRYRIRANGLERLRDLPCPVLVLPNHPGNIDPPLVLTALWPVLHPRPLVWTGFFPGLLVPPLVRLTNAVAVPGLAQASARAREETRRAVEEVIAGLRAGDNFVIWPAGHTERDGTERLGGGRAVADILSAVPEAQVVLLRTRGVWGSSLSYAYTGQAPPLARRLLEGIGLLLANLLFFIPRRDVDMTLEPIPRERLPELRREALNPWLEAWYNAEGPEPPKFVPYHFRFGPRTHPYPPRVTAAAVDLSRIAPATREAVNEIITHQLRESPAAEDLRPEMTLHEIGLDSLDRMEVQLAVEQRFGFTTDQTPMTLGQLWALAQGLAERAPVRPPPPVWFRPPADVGPLHALGDTIPEALVARALANRKDVAAADDRAGVLTYERLLVGALALARRFADLPGPNVGLLLPASVAADVAFFALHLAGKLPVVLNWTTGPAHLAHAARLMHLRHVVTARQFIDRTGVEVEGVPYLFLEDVRGRIGRAELLRRLLTVRFWPGRVRRQLPRVPPDSPAVVLFTSGSERAPKAVPLTHANILSEMRAGVPCIGLTRGDSLLGFLPAFHSFGLAVGTVMTLLGGMRVVHHPDPTDAGGLARKITAYRTTMLVGTPTFVRHILDRAKPGDLDSLRLIVVGAEKCPAALYEMCARLAPHAVLLEGYGVTECSPVVAVNRPEANRPGTVGPPLPGVGVAVVDLDSEQSLPTNRQGVLWVSGPTVFPGYLGYDGPSPFRERDGRRWYVTGDLAEIDANGCIRLAGRLQRFLKAGGEMISLPALEEPFARLYPPTDEGPRVAVEGIEGDGGRRIVLFTTEPLTLSAANAVLQREGFRGVMRLDEVRRVERIPVLGTGKVDYKVFRARLTEDKSAVPVARGPAADQPSDPRST